MGKSQIQKLKNKLQKKKQNELPFVSLCTPTYNRRPFINNMIKCFNHQIYPKEKMEWIIIDDGTDKIKDLVINIPQVKYFDYDNKMPLGEKRNLMHSKCSGDIYIYIDDDDYYPPERVSHAVEKLLSKPDVLCAGSSELYIFFKHIQKMYQFGPYGPNHATAGTFAFKKELLNDSAYENTACLAEEKHFLKNYTIPFIQLDPMKTILVVSHEHNTFDKRELLKNINNDYVRESFKNVDMFIKDSDIKKFFFEDLDNLLANYEPGDPKNKPDVLKQMKEIKASRQADLENKNNNILKTEVVVKNNSGEQIITIKQALDLLHKQFYDIDKMKHIINQFSNEANKLKEIINQKDEIINNLQSIINKPINQEKQQPELEQQQPELEQQQDIEEHNNINFTIQEIE
tara:strand:+ start:8756 stop:9958 length:1203 start_codon:yes stop_codon:yes gene_type:complete